MIQKNYLHNLTSLRGIAAVLVVVLHFNFFFGQILPKDTTGIIDKLYLMVDLFFILSGFIICYVYEKSFTKGISVKNYKQFLLARLSRIYPLHLITLLAEVALYLTVLSFGKEHLLADWQQYMYRWDGIPVQLLFLQTVGIFNFDTWNAPAWSLSAEWWAYVLFPIIFFLLIKTQKLFPKLAVAILVVGGWITIEFVLAPLQPFMQYPGNPDHISLDVNWHYGTLRGIVGFVAGMVIWHLYRKNHLRKVLGNGWSLLFLVASALCWMHFKMIDSVSVIIFSLVILSSAYGSKSINKFLSWKPFQKLGQWSFSIYMWHMVLLNCITMWFLFQRTEKIKGLLRPFNSSLAEAWTALLIILPGIILVSWLSYIYLEKPSREWLKFKLIRKGAN